MEHKKLGLFSCFVLFGTALGTSPTQESIFSRSHDSWYNYYRQNIDIRASKDIKAAKNVFMVMIDGMDLQTISMARAYANTNPDIEQNWVRLLERFTTGFVKTHGYDYMAADAAAATSAYFNGVHERNGQMGWEEQKENNCTQYDPSLKQYDNLFNVLNEANKRTGLSTNSRLTSPGVAGTYGLSPDAMLESDFHMRTVGCENSELGDLAKQLIKRYDFLNLIYGSGKNYFVGSSVIDDITGQPYSDSRTDQDLTLSWRMRKMYYLRDYSISDNVTTLSRPYDYVLALTHDEPSIENVLKFSAQNMADNQGEEGSFVAVYTDIVQREHLKNRALRAADNFVTILKHLDYIIENVINSNETLVLLVPVTGSDLHFNGDMSFTKSISTTTLTDTCIRASHINYITGPPATNENAMDRTYKSMYNSDQMLTSSATDLPVFAYGSSDFLFNGVYDRPYIYHAVLAALCLGEAANTSLCEQQMTTTTPTPKTTTTTPAPPAQPTQTPISNSGYWRILNYWNTLLRIRAANPYGSNQNSQPNTNPLAPNTNPAPAPNTNPPAPNTNPASAPNANPPSSNPYSFLRRQNNPTPTFNQNGNPAFQNQNPNPQNVPTRNQGFPSSNQANQRTQTNTRSNNINPLMWASFMNFKK